MQPTKHYVLELTYKVDATLYDEQQKPLWPNGIAIMRIVLKDKQQYDSINKQIRAGANYLLLSEKHASRINIDSQQVIIAETKVYEEKEESVILRPDGGKQMKLSN